MAEQGGALEKLCLRVAQGDTAEVCLHGGHIISWKDSRGQDLMFLSKKAIFQPPKAIRGGVPICFPQFSDFGPLGQHGFVRNRSFQVVESNDWSATLVLDYTGDQEAYPYPFELKTTISLCENSLAQELTVTNKGTAPMEFTCALHTYFQVSSIDQARVVGLKGAKYLDSLKGRIEVDEQEEAVVFDREVDRIYLTTTENIKVVDAGRNLVVEVHKKNLPDAVVWNPWIDKSKAMADFGDEEYKEMLCVEPAVAGSGPVVLPPGETWSGGQLLLVRNM